MHAPPEGFRENGAEFQQFGYAAMTRLWACPERPDGIAVYEDVTANGVIMAIMQARIDVPADLKLVLYRNAEIGLFCPFPAAFVDLRVTEIVAALIAQTRRLYAGEAVEAVVVPYHASSATVPATAAEPAATAILAPLSEREIARNG
jgi:DNA-binding LacI/PurR family transcriptional regulator